MKKRYGILILGTFACAACFLLSACAGPAAEQSSVQPPYDGQIQDADVFIDMLHLRDHLRADGDELAGPIPGRLEPCRL